MSGAKKLQRVDCDPRTADWIDRHVGVQTTLAKCEKCGLYYKPTLGHKCKMDGGAEG